MKNYKFIFTILAFIAIGLFIVVNYVDMPAPDKLNTKIIDVNDDKIK